MSEDKKKCFVIMPFSKTTREHTKDYWTNHFDNFLKPLIEKGTNLEACRSEPLRGDIANGIITDLFVSPIVIADITDRNANVYWELGVRHSLKHGTIIIADQKEEKKIPFHIRQMGVIFYAEDKAEFNKRFKKAIQDCSSNPKKQDSPVLETLVGSGSLFERFRRDETIRRLNAVLSEFELNSVFMKELFDTVEINQKDRKTLKGRFGLVNRLFNVFRLSSTAVELLVTQRYLEEDDLYYEKAENYNLLVKAINFRLERWVDNSDETEKWILEIRGLVRMTFKAFEEIAKESHDRASNRL